MSESVNEDEIPLLCAKLLMQVYNRLHKLHLCAFHQDTLKSLDKLGEGFDTKVVQWTDKLTPRVQQRRLVGYYYLV